MIKLPVKDPDTVPWMSRREIPAIKAMLSAWRKLRKNQAFLDGQRYLVSVLPAEEAARLSEHSIGFVADRLEEIALIDERLRKEARDAEAKA